MKKFVFLFACVATIGVASAINCYSCSGPMCENEMKTWAKNRCGESGTLSKDHIPVCVKMTYKDRTTGNSMIERKCIVAESKDGKPDYHCNAVNGEVKDCQQCTTDLCNSAPSARFSLFTLSSVILVLLVPKFL